MKLQYTYTQLSLITFDVFVKHSIIALVIKALPCLVKPTELSKDTYIELTPVVLSISIHIKV